MMRTCALSAVCCLLASCSGRYLIWEEPETAPLAIDPRICATVEPEPVEPEGAAVIAPITEEEARALRLHLFGDQSARSWGRRGWELVAIAQERCEDSE